MIRWQFIFFAIPILCAVGLAADSDSPHPHRSFGSPLATYVGTECESALDAAAAGDGSDESWNASLARSEAAFQILNCYGNQADADGFREAAFARRLIRQLQTLDRKDRVDLLKFMRSHDALAEMTAFNLQSGKAAAASLTLIDTLRKIRPAQVEHLPNLAVALAIVRSRPLQERVNENTATADDPLAVFDFYVAHESQMALGLTQMPVELLEYVVDTSASVDDMNWAVRRYPATTDVGQLFFTISYDYAAFQTGSPKKLDAARFSLSNILKYGGVCIDQAYFAETVGKSIGIPTAIAIAASAEVGHAWIGFLQVRGKSAEWNFDSGRYPQYQGLRGNVRDPKTDSSVADSTVTMTGDLIGTTDIQRQTAAAYTDAAMDLIDLDSAKVGQNKPARHRRHDETSDEEASGEESANSTPAHTATPLWPPAWPPSVEQSKPARIARSQDSVGVLELSEFALRQYSSYIPAWHLVAALAKDHRLDDAQEHRWADLILKKCGSRHPDFALEILDPMINAVADAQAQSDLWDAAFALVKGRPDLAASVRMQQAALWKKTNNLTKAGRCYEDVLQHFLNAGPFALPALHGAEEVLTQMNQQSRVLDLYAMAVRTVTPPGQMAPEFVRQSNWYNVREAYAKALDDAGRARDAEAIRAQDEKLGGSTKAAAGG